MIRPINDTTPSPFTQFVEKHPLGFVLVIIAAIATVAVIIPKIHRKYYSPEALYQRALKAPPELAITLLMDAAHYKHVKARKILAAIFLKNKLHDEAIKLCQEVDDAESIYLQGLIYEDKKEPLKALQKFVIASMRGFVPAFIRAGVGFLERDLKTALSYFERGVAADDPESMLARSGLLMSGVGSELTRENSTRGIDLIRRAAILNSIEACNMLSHIYLQGLHNHLDENEVRNRLEYASGKKDTKALLSLGMQKLYGSLLYLKNTEEALQILQRIPNNSTAFLHIGKHYQSQNNTLDALQWFLKGAELDHPECLYQAYLITNKAEYLGRAGNKNHPQALFELAKIALREDRIDLSIHYLNESSKAGNEEAQFVYVKTLSRKRYDDELMIQKIVEIFNALGKKHPICFFHLYQFYRLHDQEEKAIQTLVEGSSRDNVDCMKALYSYHSQIPEEIVSTELLLRRIRAREPSFMVMSEDVEIDNEW